MKGIKKALLITLSSVFVFGFSIPKITYAESAASLEPQISVSEGSKLKFETPEKSKVVEEKTEELKNPVANKAINKLKNGDVFNFHGVNWIVLNAEEGYAMMEKSVNELDLLDAKFDINVPYQVLDYFNTTYMELMSKEEKELLQKPSLSLINYEGKLHVSAYFKPELKINKNGELAPAAKEKKEKKDDDDSSKNQNYMLWAGGIVLVIFAGALGIIIKNKKYRKATNQQSQS